MWMMPLHLHVNQKSDYIIYTVLYYSKGTFRFDDMMLTTTTTAIIVVETMYVGLTFFLTNTL